MKKKMILLLFAGILAVSVMACDDVEDYDTADSQYSDDYSDDEYSDEDYSDEDYSDENYDEESDSDSEEAASSGQTEASDFTNDSIYPLGTCKELEGTFVIMSIAADDATTSWDFDNADDANTLAYISEKFAIGLKWIEDMGKQYGKDINFIYNWDEDNELFYTAQLSEDYGTNNGNYRQDTKTFIDENLSSYAANLVNKYNADGIMFVFYFNEPENTDFVCFAEPYIGTDLGMDYPYEVLCVDKYVYGAQQGPATYAHEVLHLFGAPDFYNVDTDGSNHGMTEEFVSYCQQNHLNEIMNATYDPYNNVIPENEVTNDLTDLTAYYIGWVDSNEECEAYGVDTSEHK